MEINEKLEVFFGAAIGAANSQSESMLDEQKNIYQSAMEEHEQSCRDALKSSRRIFLEKQKKEVNRRNAEQTMAWKKDYQALKEQKTEELFEMVKEKLLSYRRTDAYEAFLLAQIGKAKEFAQGEDLTVFISPSDQERQAVLEEKSGCRVEIAEDEFSGGMRQRAALIRTLALKPDLLLLDEPFSALDYQTRLNVSDDIGKILKKQRKPAILVTHDISEAISMADRVLILSKRPATVIKIVPIDLDMKDRTPLSSRNAPAFKSYFNLIWKELNQNA